jgi:hypothetical protein
MKRLRGRDKGRDEEIDDGRDEEGEATTNGVRPNKEDGSGTQLYFPFMEGVDYCSLILQSL